MGDSQGIIVYGPNGSGKTTLGRELSRILGYRHMDIEDYFFEKSAIPYTVARSQEECRRLLLADMERYGSFVLTAVTGAFGPEITERYSLAVCLSAPAELRMERIRQRAYEQHGDRIREGGDMYEQEQKFLEFAATRPLWKIDQWAETLICPIIPVDGTADWRANAEKIAKHIRSLS